MPGSARLSEGEQTTKIFKMFLRYAKALKYQSMFNGKTESQVCQDLLDQAKASRPLKSPKRF